MTGETLAEALAEATQILARAGVPSPRVDAELLAAHLMAESLGRIRSLALTGATVPPEFGELVAERARRVPLQHITGKAYFRHLELQVGPGVFIPRPETETVAQYAIDRAVKIPRAKVVDLGTGSGAIAASIAQEVPGAEVIAVELSDLAHAWAARNLEPWGVTLVQEDLRTALTEHDGTFDVVVSNPPYIPAEAVPRDPEVAEHDPQIALYGGGADGLQLPAATASTAARLLKSGGYFIMEHAEVQAEAVSHLLHSGGCWNDVATVYDLTGRERATAAVRR
ncbi:peptide chain release factor N(5)-glutamine methyltransferase [Arthrobacter sp. VKM Ac-2550]|uniref:peptide chain release factor N(5)-glutamine methyltransferase n=1 Tax=Crystallibacter permensis TaxID=1938888 RepID=UPI00222729D7|nr:peptide chain release factor N(5)-glutamine methyltransferase [Arthrobacter sp. VKM Ac-2550]MCW2132648.1 release factor glutamine methyltransferase [Arthrobacter sp. VKM Ac-2550]